MISRLIILLAMLFCSHAALAQTEVNKWQRYAVGDQVIHLVFATHIDFECASKGESRLAIIQPPKNGKLTGSMEAGYSSFTGTYTKCNEKKIDGLRVVFTANPGFKGKDKFVFAVVYVDGEIRRYEIDMTVW